MLLDKIDRESDENRQLSWAQNLKEKPATLENMDAETGLQIC